MRVHLVNPSDVSFGVGVITPRWLYVLAAATPPAYGDPIITDETLETLDPNSIQPGDVVGIGIHTANAFRGMEVGRLARERGAWVVYGGIHATLFPEEALEFGAAHAVVKGDGDAIWKQVLADCEAGNPQQVYDGGKIGGSEFLGARWDLLPEKSYMWASVQTVRGCPKHCSFCSVWRTDGQKPRQRSNEVVVREIVQLRRIGFRFIALADDNFYPVTLTDIANAERQGNQEKLAELRALRGERFDLMERLAALPADTVLYTQITMESAEDPAFLDAMKKAHILGALVGVESVTPEGLKAVFKDFNETGDSLAKRLRTFREHGIHVLGSFIFGLSSDRADTFDATAALASEAKLTFAQFVTMTPYPGTVDFGRWEKELEASGGAPKIDGVPITRYWRLPWHRRPRLWAEHSTMSQEEIRVRTQGVWDRFYSFQEIWKRADCVKSLKAKMAFTLISKLYRAMYANTGIATDSARRKSASKSARFFAKAARGLFAGKPMPELAEPGVIADPLPVLGQ
ncbi:MAG: radical SAM protein [Bryobacteraceae bacterium]|nr:radical SAM protein [Bryobacteraceae bacterium]